MQGRETARDGKHDLPWNMQYSQGQIKKTQETLSCQGKIPLPPNPQRDTIAGGGTEWGHPQSRTAHIHRCTGCRHTSHNGRLSSVAAALQDEPRRDSPRRRPTHGAGPSKKTAKIQPQKQTTDKRAWRYLAVAEHKGVQGGPLIAWPPLPCAPALAEQQTGGRAAPVHPNEASWRGNRDQSWNNTQTPQTPNTSRDQDNDPNLQAKGMQKQIPPAADCGSLHFCRNTEIWKYVSVFRIIPY